MHSRSQMTNQSYEACSIGDKIMRERCSLRKSGEKNKIGEGYKTLGNPGKRLNRGRTPT